MNPTKLIVKKARVKNFLSYGNDWQEVEFPRGLVLVQGLNVDTDKSNGSGKSSITEIIPFALFGKTIKDIPQGKIINWNNRTGCEVELHFDIGGKSYIFNRGLKPNKFKVLCDGQQVVRTADIRIFQQQMEDEIIGMDFKTFKNLIYFSPNNTISILGAKKEQKRLFLESLFDLSDYSGMLKIANERIKNYSWKIKELEIESLSSEQNIDFIQGELDKCKEIDLSSIDKNIFKLKFELGILKGDRDNRSDVDELSRYDEKKARLDILRSEYGELSNRKSEISTSIKHIEGDIKSSKIDDLRSKRDGIITKIRDIKDDLDMDDNDMSDMLVRITEIKEIIVDNDNKCKEAEGIKATLKSDEKLMLHKISEKESHISKLRKADKLDNVSICPLCKSGVDHDHVKDWYDKEISTTELEIIGYKESLNSIRVNIESPENVIFEAGIEKTSLTSEALEIKKKIEGYRTKKKEINDLETLLGYLPDIEAVQKELDDKKSQLESLASQLKDVEWKMSLTQDDIESYKEIIDKLDKLKDEISRQESNISDITKQIESLKVHRDEMVLLNKKESDRIASMTAEMSKHKSLIDKNDKEIRKINKMVDYLNYIRTSLKDENVKQFAISALLPYLNHRANHYLSESGFPYSVEIDGWLDVIIRGMGTEDVGYNSLSGGESKAMDMAVQLACNDIAELQAKTSLGISIYDEILDTSLDADGVQKLMDIIRVRQSESNDCVLCITHRDEIKELEFDHNIMILKKNGFSSIQ